MNENFESAEYLYSKYPKEKYIQTVLGITVELEQSYKKVIQRKRDQYNKLNSFKEKKHYYDTTLKLFEEIYIQLTEQIKTFRETKNPQRYELWVTPRTIEQMKEYGYRTIIELEISKGGII